MHIAIAVLLFVMAALLFQESHITAYNRGVRANGNLGGVYALAMIAVASLILGLLQLTVPIHGIHVAIAAWLFFLGGVSTLAVFKTSDDLLYLICAAACCVSGFLQLHYVV